MQNVRAKLEKKGWQKHHIDHAEKTIKEAQQKKYPYMNALDHAVYWFSLSVAIVGNFIISLVLIPLLLTLNGLFLYTILVVIGISFGLLFELLIKTIEHLETKHHLFLIMLVPLVAIINLIAIVLFANGIGLNTIANNTHNPIIIAAVYSSAFMFPYLIYNVILSK